MKEFTSQMEGIHIPRVIKLGRSTVSFELNTTQEQREKVIWSYAYEHAERLIEARKNPLFNEMKNFLRIHQDEIMQNPKNAHLRREVKKPE